MAVKYDKDIDYQALINEAVAKGDYMSAAKYEQSRNAKINDLNASGTNKYNATTTNKYGGWLDTTDYATILKDQMASGASAKDVAATLGKRVEKAAGTEGLSQYAYDDMYQQAMDYITNYKETPTFDSGSFETSKPTYESSYSSRIDQMLNEILNRDDFSYSAEADPLFQQYKSQYQREGQRSMNDTLAAAASQAGGMNSWAMTAAQQANDYYAAQLGDKVPELYQLAYQMFLDDKASKVENLGLVEQMDDRQYGRFRDTMSDWRDDRDFAYTKYRDDVGDLHWDKSFDHGVEQDNIDNEYRQDQADIANNTNAQNGAYDRAMELLQSGVMPGDALLQKAGISKEQAQAYIDNGYGYNREQNEAANASDAQSDAFDRAMKMLQSGIMPSPELLQKAGIPTDEAKKVYDNMWYVDNEGGGNPGGGDDEYEKSDDGDKSESKDPYADTRSEITSDKPNHNKLSDSAMNKLKSLQSMQGMIGSKDAIANSIAVYADSGDITMAEAEYMFRYFGYDPKDWIEY